MLSKELKKKKTEDRGCKEEKEVHFSSVSLLPSLFVYTSLCLVSKKSRSVFRIKIN